MERETLRRHLDWAEEQVAQAERFVAKQRMVVARLEHEKGDTAEATRLLAQLELRREVHVADRDNLRFELWKLGETVNWTTTKVRAPPMREED
jgi:hypothetical protein